MQPFFFFLITHANIHYLDPKDPSLQITVTRYTYPTIFGVFVVVLAAFLVKKLVSIWMDTVRDDTYLIGRQLHNMQNNQQEESAATASTIDTAVVAEQE